MKKSTIIFWAVALGLSSTLCAQGPGSAVHGTITCTNSTGLGFTSSFSLEMWIKPTATDLALDGCASLIDKRDYIAKGGYELRIDKQRLRLVLVNGAGSELFTTSDAGIFATNQWQHVAAITEYSGGNATSRVYLNGIEKVSFTRVDPEMNPSETDLLISHSQYVSVYRLDGQLDEVRIWNRALSVSELRANMCRKLSGSESGLEAYWNFDDPEQRDADLTANEHGGTGSGFIAYLSGAPIGDASTCDYSSAATLTLSAPEGDAATLQSISGLPDGVHIYRVDEAPNNTNAPGTMIELSGDHYYGTYFVGESSPTATLVYDYATHPEFTDEPTLELARRDANDSTAWIQTNTVQDSSANTLSLTNIISGEYILGRVADAAGFSITQILLSGTQLTLYWTPCEGAASYSIQSAATPTNDFSIVTTVSGTNWTGTSSDTTRFFRIGAEYD